jgi:hypothetical protein
MGVTAARPKPGCGRSRTLTGQCRWPLCPGDSTNHSDGLPFVTKYRRQRGGLIPQGFRGLRSLAHHPSRNVTPPRLSSPGPFVVVRYLATLAAYPGKCQVRVKISGRAWTRSGRIRFHQFSFLLKSHRLRLSQQHLRFTRSPKRKRGLHRYRASLARRALIASAASARPGP